MRIKSVLSSYRVSWDYLWSLAAIHLSFRLLTTALIAPLIGALLALAVGLSNQKALTDQDIAAFILSPIGFLGTLIVLSVVIAAAILDFTAMTIVLAARKKDPIEAVRHGVGILASDFLRMIWYSCGLILRILVIAAPYLAVGFYIAVRNLTEFDINYYLTYWPPEFIRTLVIIAVILVGMAGTLLFYLAGWGISLHLYLMQKLPIGKAFKESRSRLVGLRFDLVVRLVIWGAIRTVIVGSIALFFGGLNSFALTNSGENLRLTVVIILSLFAIWGVVYTLGTALVNGALAGILLKIYSTAVGENFEDHLVSKSKPMKLRIPIWAFLVGAGAVVIAGIFFANRTLETFKDDLHVEIIAHRGAANLRPENTMSAIVKAIEDGTDWVEIDVQESAEGELIIAHDSDFMKLANNPLKTWDSTRVDLDKIDIGSWFDPEYSSERTPLLQDVLRASKGRAKVVIELKYYGHDVNLESEVIRVVEEEGMVGQISMMSLKYPAVLKLRELRPDWEVGVLAAKAVGDVAGLDASFLALNSGQISSGLLRDARAKGKVVYAWTVDDPVQMTSLIMAGVDGLITNDPALARSVLEFTNSLTGAERFVLWVADFLNVLPDTLVADETDA